MIKRPRWSIRSGLSFFEANLQSEVHSGSSSMSEHPTDSGATIADHVVNDPDSYSCELIFSDTPFLIDGGLSLPYTYFPKPDDRIPLNASGLLNKAISATQMPVVLTGVTQFLAVPGVARDFVREAYEYFFVLKDDATIVDITTPIRTYYDMVLLGLDVSRQPGMGGGATFSLTFRHWKTVAVSTTDVLAQVAAALRSPRDGVKPELGVQAKPPPVDEEEGSSILAGLIGL